jgi:hypothetical protein
MSRLASLRIKSMALPNIPIHLKYILSVKSVDGDVDVLLMKGGLRTPFVELHLSEKTANFLYFAVGVGAGVCLGITKSYQNDNFLPNGFCLAVKDTKTEILSQ